MGKLNPSKVIRECGTKVHCNPPLQTVIGKKKGEVFGGKGENQRLSLEWFESILGRQEDINDSGNP